MRSGSLLLFTLIASFILAVSPIPMNQNPAGLRKLAPKPITGKRPGPNTPPEIVGQPLAKKARTIATVTLLDGRTGETSTTGGSFRYYREIRAWLEQQIFEEIFGMGWHSYKIEWKGLYDPSPSEQFSRRGDALGSGFPCVPHKCGGFGKRYIGVSPGHPVPNYFEGEWGKPVSETADLVIDALGEEWENLLAEFKAYFIGPRVTFISGIDGDPLPGPDYTRSGLNAAINGALHRGSNDRITYHGPYLLFPGNQPSVIFKLAAVGQCIEGSLCLEWIEQDALHSQTYVGIVKEYPERNPPFMILGKNPATTFEEHHEAYINWDELQPTPSVNPLGEKWLKFMEGFDTQWAYIRHNILSRLVQGSEQASAAPAQNG